MLLVVYAKHHKAEMLIYVDACGDGCCSRYIEIWPIYTVGLSSAITNNFQQHPDANLVWRTAGEAHHLLSTAAESTI